MERVELHTKMSKDNETIDVRELLAKAEDYGMTTIAITDFNNVQAFQEISKCETNLKILYGVEVELENYNIIIIAKNQIGLKNLYKILSDSYINNDSKISKDILESNRDGLLIGCSCSKSEIYQAILKNKSQKELKEISKFYDYIEIQPNFKNIVNKRIVELGEQLNKMVVATSNVHFLDTKEMLRHFEYLGKKTAYEIVVENTNKIANLCESIELLPKRKCYPIIKNSKKTIKDICKKRLKELYGENITTEIKNRYESELKAIFENNYENIYMIAYLIAKKAKEDGEFFTLRGIGSSSFVAYLLEISFINPFEYNLSSEFFFLLGISGDKEPDFDFNFRKEYQKVIHSYIIDLFGKDKVFYCGTIKNGIHPGGLIFIPEDREVYEFTPIHYSELDKKICTYFDYHFLEFNLLKIDLLFYDNLQLLKNLEEVTGVKRENTNIHDLKIFDLFKEDESGEVATDGIPEFEMKFVKNIIKQVKPTKIEDLIKIVSLSHGTNTWTLNNEEFSKHHNIDELACSRDDIFLFLLSKGITRELAFEIAEFVRKGRATKKIYFSKEQYEEYQLKWGEYTDIMKKAKVPEWYIDSISRVHYMFPKAHSCNNTVLSLIIAWYKVYYPTEFEKELLVCKR